MCNNFIFCNKSNNYIINRQKCNRNNYKLDPFITKIPADTKPAGNISPQDAKLDSEWENLSKPEEGKNHTGNADDDTNFCHVLSVYKTS